MVNRSLRFSGLGPWYLGISVMVWLGKGIEQRRRVFEVLDGPCSLRCFAPTQLDWTWQEIYDDITSFDVGFLIRFERSRGDHSTYDVM